MAAGHDISLSVLNEEKVEKIDQAALEKHLYRTKGNKQLKWKGSDTELARFLSERLEVNESDIQVSCNGSCSVLKTVNLTLSFQQMKLLCQSCLHVCLTLSSPEWEGGACKHPR